MSGVGRFFVAAAFLAALAPGAGAAPAQHIEVATQPLTAQAPLFIAADKGYFAAEGLDVAFQFVGSGTLNLQLLAMNQADVGTGSPGPALWNAMARGIPVKITAAISSLSPDPKTGFTSALWLVLPKGSPIRSYADLKGKRVAVLGLGLGTEIVVDEALKDGGLTLDDVDLKELRGPDVLTAFANGGIDAATEIEPFVTEGAAKGILVKWKNAAAITPGRVAAVMMFGPRLLAQGSDLGARFMTAWTRAARDYNDAFGPNHIGEDAIIAILAKHTEVKDPALYRTMTWHYIDPNCATSVAALTLDADWDVAHGFIPKPPDFANEVDGRYCAAAREALGPYKPR